MFDKSNVRNTPYALQMPLQRNAARQTQRLIGNEYNYGVSKCNDAVGVIEALVMFVVRIIFFIFFYHL
jgi:hypothetical protein